MKWNLKGGIIVIGSLLWQDHLNEKDDDIRLNWRNNNLDMDNIIPIKVPIRYGRLSQSNIPTIVFSNHMTKKLGTGYVIPFKRIIDNEDELRKEVVALSTVEGLKGNIVRNWGVLTYLFSDEDAHTKNKYVSEFFKKNKNKDFDCNDYKVDKEIPCIYPSLKLKIDWIKPINDNGENKLDKLDFLLATATKPNIKLNEINKISKYIKDDKKRYYYLNNITNGIITNDDYEISKLL